MCQDILNSHFLPLATKPSLVFPFRWGKAIENSQILWNATSRIRYKNWLLTTELY